MKKTILLIASLMFVFASASFAALIDSTGTSIGSQSYKPSNNVTIVINSNATRYAAESGHTKGNRVYGTNSDETKIFYKDVAVPITSTNNPVTVATNDDPAADTGAFPLTDGWNSL
jgi:hypothetical protein